MHLWFGLKQHEKMWPPIFPWWTMHNWVKPWANCGSKWSLLRCPMDFRSMHLVALLDRCPKNNADHLLKKQKEFENNTNVTIPNIDINRNENLKVRINRTEVFEDAHAIFSRCTSSSLLYSKYQQIIDIISLWNNAEERLFNAHDFVSLLLHCRRIVPSTAWTLLEHTRWT